MVSKMRAGEGPAFALVFIGAGLYVLKLSVARAPAPFSVSSNAENAGFPSFAEPPPNSSQRSFRRQRKANGFSITSGSVNCGEQFHRPASVLTRDRRRP